MNVDPHCTMDVYLFFSALLYIILNIMYFSTYVGKCFVGVHAHVLLAGIGQARAGIFQKQIIQNGGQVYGQFCPEVTHIIVDEGMDCDRAFRLLKVQKLPPGMQLVKCSWLSLCIKEKKIVNTVGYSIFIPERYSLLLLPDTMVLR